MNSEMSWADTVYKCSEEIVNGEHFPYRDQEEIKKAALGMAKHWCYDLPSKGPNGKIIRGIHNFEQALSFFSLFNSLLMGKPGRMFQNFTESIKLYQHPDVGMIFDNYIGIAKKEKIRLEIDGDIENAQKIKPLINMLKVEQSLPIVPNVEQTIEKIVNAWREYIDLVSFMWTPDTPREIEAWLDAQGNDTHDQGAVVEKVTKLFPQWITASTEAGFQAIFDRELESRGGSKVMGPVFKRTLHEHVTSLISAYEHATPPKDRDIELIQCAEKFLNWLSMAKDSQQVAVKSLLNLQELFTSEVDYSHAMQCLCSSEPAVLGPTGNFLLGERQRKQAISAWFRALRAKGKIDTYGLNRDSLAKIFNDHFKGLDISGKTLETKEGALHNTYYQDFLAIIR